MKKAIIITLLVALVGLYATAQKLTYGVKVSGGFAYQKIDNEEILSASSIATFNIRGIAQLPLKNNFWVEAGLGIAGKGSVVYNDALTTTTHLSYIEIPRVVEYCQAIQSSRFMTVLNQNSATIPFKH